MPEGPQPPRPTRRVNDWPAERVGFWCGNRQISPRDGLSPETDSDARENVTPERGLQMMKKKDFSVSYLENHLSCTQENNTG